MRLVLDGTPLLGHRTGVGQYTARLIHALPGALARAGLDAQLDVTTFTLRGGRLDALPDGVRQVGPRVPARALRKMWSTRDHPTVEALVGRCDVVHGTNFVSPPTRVAREVVTVHDLTYELHSGTVSADSLAYRTLVRRALDRGAHVVTPSQTVASAVRDFYELTTDRVTATPLGVDHDWFTAEPLRPARLDGLGVRGPYLVFVGSLDPRKNLPRLVAAHAEASAADPSVPMLVLAGPAGRETGLVDSDHVVRTGWLEDADLRSLVAGAAALVLPSLDEGFGLPALEALACGRPVLAADIPALREVTDGHATLADPEDTDAMAAALSAVVATPDDEAARRARRAHASRWTWGRCADETVKAYGAGTAVRDRQAEPAG